MRKVSATVTIGSPAPSGQTAAGERGGRNGLPNWARLHDWSGSPTVASPPSAITSAWPTQRNAYLANEKAGSDHEPLPVPMSAAGERLLRILAGFNLVLLAGVIGVGVGQFVAEFESAWWAVVPASVVVFVLVLWLLTTVGPLNAHPGVHVLGWVVVGLLALLSSPPVGLLVLTGVMISTWGRRVVRAGATEPARWLVRSPLPWLAAALYTAVVISYEAMPPISFPGFVVNGTSAQVIGGKLAQSGRSVHLIVCTPLADATSIQPHLRDVTAAPGHTQATVAAAFDSGARPTLASLALDVFGIDWPQGDHRPESARAHSRRARTRLRPGSRSGGRIPNSVAASSSDRHRQMDER